MFLHQRKNTKVTPHTPGVLVMDVILNHIDELFHAVQQASDQPRWKLAMLRRYNTPYFAAAPSTRES
ncbi:hypothetical protein CE91St28_02530 [Pyramidobacter piscolens]|nr:hypothetical protein CE91St28_02530 [Pyramidobacter piscolens]